MVETNNAHLKTYAKDGFMCFILKYTNTIFLQITSHAFMLNALKFSLIHPHQTYSNQSLTNLYVNHLHPMY